MPVNRYTRRSLIAALACAVLLVSHHPIKAAEAAPLPAESSGAYTAAVPLQASAPAAASDGVEYDWSDLAGGVHGNVYALLRDGSDLYVAGSFNEAGGITANNIARWNMETGTWHALGDGTMGTVHALARNGPYLFVGGDVLHEADDVADHLMVWDIDIEQWSRPLPGQFEDRILALAVTDHALYIGGNFFNYPGQYLVQWRLDVPTFNIIGLPEAPITNFAVSGDDVYVGGDYLHINNNHDLAGVARWRQGEEVGQGQWQTVGDAGVDGLVHTIALNGNEVCIGGSFFITPGGPAVRAACLTPEDELEALGSGLDGGVLALSFSGPDDLIAGGAFNQAGDETAMHLARWSFQESSWHPIGEGTDGIVRALALDGRGGFFAGGLFDTAGGAEARNIIRVSEAAQVFEAELSGLHITQPTLSAGSGFMTAELTDGNRLTVSGTFENLTSPYTMSHIHLGDVGTDGPVRHDLEPTMVGTDVEGEFFGADNTLELSETEVAALHEGRLFVMIHSQNYPPGEIRGQLFPAVNQAPDHPALTAPDDNQFFDVLEDENETLEISWGEVTDPDGDEVFYYWQLALDNGFETPVAHIRSAAPDFLEIPFDRLDELLADAGVRTGTETTFFHRVTASDGSLMSPGDVRRIRLQRGPNRPPEIVEPIDDLQLAIGRDPIQFDLTVVFEDPDQDEMTFTVQVEDQEIVSAQIVDETLSLEGLAVGNSRVTVGALDEKDAFTDLSFEVTVLFPSPEVRHTPRAAAVTANEPLPVTVELEEDQEDVTVVLHYRGGGDSAFTEATMVEAAGIFGHVIPAGSVTSRGLEYFFTATHPQAHEFVSGRFSVSVAVEAPGESHQQSGGSEQNAYRLLAMPLNLDDASARGVLEEDLGQPDDHLWRIFELQANQQYREGPSNVQFSPGRAHWLIVRETSTITTGSAESQPLHEPFRLSLHAGWNFVGNPFNFPLPLSQVSLESGSDVQLQSFDGAFSQVTGGNLQPFRGYAIHVETSDELIFEPAPPGAGKQPAADRRIAGTDLDNIWQIQIAARIEDARDTENFAAVSGHVTGNRNERDWRQAPVIGEYVSTYFVHRPGEGEVTRLSADIRPEPEDGVMWDLEVTSNISGRVELAFDGINGVPPKFGVWLVDPAAGVVQDLRQKSSYAVSSSGTGEPYPLKLAAGTESWLDNIQEPLPETPRGFTLAQNYPNPFAVATSILYTLPEPAPIELSVYDVLGKEITVLLEAPEHDAGRHQVVWDGRDRSGTQVSSGVYVIVIRSAGRQEARRVMVVR